MEDNSNFYVLGYTPTPFIADRKFHDAKVAVTARPGLHARARKGYVADAAPTAANSGAGVTTALGTRSRGATSGCECSWRLSCRKTMARRPS